jgi:hypothetical protein
MNRFPLNATYIATTEFIVQESVIGPDDDENEEDDKSEVALLAAPEEW